MDPADVLALIDALPGRRVAVIGDVVANGSVSVAAGSLRVGGDIYARCQSSIGGAVNACYPSGAGTPCSFPDVAGATRSGFRLPDPGFPAPSVSGSQGIPSSNVVVSSISCP